MIGYLGSYITFQCNSDVIEKFDSLSVKTSAKYATHGRIGDKDLPEKVGDDLETATFNILLSAEFKVSPRKTLQNLRQAVLSGDVVPLVVGGQLVGPGYFTIKELGQDWSYMYNGGQLVSATGSITLQEYPFS